MSVADALELHSNLRDYTAVFESDGRFVESLASTPNRAFVIDENVWRLHRGGILAPIPEEDVFVLPIGEELKTLSSVERVWDSLLDRSAKRNMNLISIGGGICQDVTGFAASTLYRGIGWTFVPTTLLAQADSCIGSKTSLNYRHFKNLLGTFYPPLRVHIYSPFLSTQDEVDFFSGVGEAVKLHIMGGVASAGALEAVMPAVSERDAAVLRRVTRTCLVIKKGYIEGDEFDSGRRNLLNYGHCFGHAIETATDYAVPHGQAVVLGMIVAQRVALSRGMFRDPDQVRLMDGLLAAALRVDVESLDIDEDAVVEAMKHDKKRTGDGLALVMAADDFEMIKVNDLSVEEARGALRHTGTSSWRVG